MTVPEGEWLIVEEAASTQDLAARGKSEVVLARRQTAGRGRHGRVWHSEAGSSLAASIAFTSYKGHPRPWLIGMSVAVAAAGALHCSVRWPNDLILAGKKLGGVLTEIVDETPIVGIGVNLGPMSFADALAGIATTLADHRESHPHPKSPHRLIHRRFRGLPEPDSWQTLLPVWSLFDETPGKSYTLATGECATAVGIGPEGELLALVAGESVSVMAASAVLVPI